MVEFYYPEEIVHFEREFIEAQQAAYKETAIEDDEICLRMDRGRRALWEAGPGRRRPLPVADGRQHGALPRMAAAAAWKGITAEHARLHRRAGAPIREWRVFDCRHDLIKPELGEQQYRESHIPGAVFAHLDRDLSAPKTRKQRPPSPARPEAFIAWLGQQGLQPTDQVVCYDGGPGAKASRLWWMLRWVGHEQVAVLDGGFAKWQRKAGRSTAEVPRSPRRLIPGKRAGLDACRTSSPWRRNSSARRCSMRARRRATAASRADRPGRRPHPGLDEPLQRRQPQPKAPSSRAEAFRAEFEAVLAGRNPREVIHYCGSGVVLGRKRRGGVGHCHSRGLHHGRCSPARRFRSADQQARCLRC